MTVLTHLSLCVCVPPLYASSFCRQGENINKNTMWVTVATCQSLTMHFEIESGRLFMGFHGNLGCFMTFLS